MGTTRQLLAVWARLRVVRATLSGAGTTRRHSSGLLAVRARRVGAMGRKARSSKPSAASASSMAPDDQGDSDWITGLLSAEDDGAIGTVESMPWSQAPPASYWAGFEGASRWEWGGRGFSCFWGRGVRVFGERTLFQK